MPITLAHLPVLVADGQSTGASPAHGHLLELGWAPTHAALGEDALQVDARLIALPDGATIPRPVARLTGITVEHLADASPVAEVWAALCEAASGDPTPRPVVIHYARFESAFLHALHEQLAPQQPFPLRLVCTHEIARRLLPQLPRRGLRALAGYFGLGVDELKRSAEHVHATALVWRHVVQQLDEEHAIDTLEALEAWLAEPAPKPSARHAYPMDRDKRLALPDAPGVYRMTRLDGDVLYVGKARSLRRRVNGYFRQHRRVAEHTLQMLTQARDLRVTTTANALEAALLESDEIKALDPPYNVMLRTAGRGIWYGASDLRSWRPAPDRRHRRGPFTSRAVLSAWPALLDLWAEPPAGTVVLPWVDAEIDAPTWRAGAEQFTETWLDGRCPRAIATLVGAGTQIGEAWRDAAEAAAAERGETDGVESEPTEPAEPGPESGERPWDPSRVVEALERMVGQGALELRRAAWLPRLANAAVAWERPDGRWRSLVVEGGRVVHREDRTDTSALPVVRAAAPTIFDVPTFDRLRVLTTELRRIVAGGRVVRLQLGRRPLLSGARLVRTLRTV
ncbi:MAG: hypothetical protein K0V04_30640 [Deltaproteobacteria bacterium]|nr:hypothetical protein [Deltaproteobacteria bacterium]